MDFIEKKISTLVESQFPSFYREEGPIFIAFVREYYKWLETEGQTLYHNRRLYDYKDVDTTTNDFIVFFKEKYLKNIQFTTTSNVRQLIKHALDIYRSRGTERAVDLLFRLVFGVGAEVYYPSTDVFRLSDGTWKQPVYLEVTLNDKNVNFANRQILGLKSGAKAFVEKVIRRTVAGKFDDVLYISAIIGTFQTGEIIVIDGDDTMNSEKIRIVGSLSGVLISEEGVGSGFVVGDLVDLSSSRGRQGKGRITEISDITGLINFQLINGGWGYTANSEVLVSEKVLQISNVHVNTEFFDEKHYFKTFSQLIQPKATLEYNTLDGANSIPVGSNVYTYHANNDVKGFGRVIVSNPDEDGTTGNIEVAIISGDIEDDFYTESNVISGLLNIGGYTDKTAVGNVIAVSANLDLIINNPVGEYIRNERVFVSNSTANIASATVLSYETSGVKGILKLIDRQGIFVEGETLVGEASGALGNVESSLMTIGLIDLAGNDSFVARTGNYVYSPTYNVNGTVTIVGEGSGATFGISNDLLFSKSTRLNDDFLRDKANVALDAVSYGFAANASANLTTCTIEEALHWVIKDLGKVRSLININRGSNYTFPPFIRIFEPLSYPFRKNDYYLVIANTSGTFKVGEIVEQESSNNLGIIKANSNSSVLFVERFALYNNTELTVSNTTSNTLLVGRESGAICEIVDIIPDANSEYIGYNANVTGSTISDTGAAISMAVADSGFGYLNGERIDFQNEDGIVSGIAIVEGPGRSQGFYTKKGGFLSDEKKLFDGLYYQDYSYEVRASVSLDKYQEMLKKILHVAGTKAFGAFVYQSVVNTNVFVESEEVLITKPSFISTEDEIIIETEDEELFIEENG